jgi:hypothetical protein
MKKLALMVALAVAAYFTLVPDPTETARTGARLHASLVADTEGSQVTLEQAFTRRLSRQQLVGEGVVSRLLSDDNDGSGHQRFIVRLASGRTLLIAHNVDLAPRIDALAVGDSIAFSGVYEWNAKGGVVHWTHHDPQGHHPGGWIRHQGRTYQ